MNSKIITFSGMTIASVALFFASGATFGDQQVFAFGGFGHGLGHFYGPGFGHYYGPGLGYYVPGYPVYNPCGGGPYSIINGQIVCTTG
jgi:hypothetical protein